MGRLGSYGCFAFFLAACLAVSDARAEGLLEGRPRFERGGSFKSIFQYQTLKQTGVFSRNDSLGTEQRLRLEGALVWGTFRLEIADETSFFAQTPLRASIPLPSALPTPAWNPRWTITSNDTIQAITRLDRALLKWTQGPVSIIAGKQVVALGVGHLFTAVSQTPRQPFVIVDPEYPIPEDAVTLQWDGALAVEARFLPKNPGQKSDNFHFRAKGSKGGYDLALTAGRSDDKSFVALETAGNLNDSLLRGELTLYDRAGTTVGQGLAGIDHAFNAKWSAEAEVFYAGALVHRPSPYLGKWYAGARVKWEASERWRLWAMAIANLNDPSVLGHVSLTYSMATSLDLGFGQFVGFGKGSSEFGGQISIAPGLSYGLPNLTYVLARYYF